MDITKDCANFCARAGGCAHLAVPFRTVANDGRNIRQCFYVVYQGWFAPKSFGSGIRRSGPRFSAFSFKGFDQRGFFTADIRASARVHVHVEIETRTKNVFTQKTVGFRLLDG